MAGEGLFFTGVVLKNNRNLLQEQATRDSLQIQKDELKLRQDEAAARRRKEREEGSKAISYSGDDINARLQDPYRANYDEYRNYMEQNSLDVYDLVPDAVQKRGDFESNLVTDGEKLKKISLDYKIIKDKISSGEIDTSKLLTNPETGNFIFEENFDSIVNGYSGGESLDTLMSDFSLEYNDVVDIVDFIDPSNGLLDDILAKDENKPKVDQFQKDGRVTTTTNVLTDNVLNQFKQELRESLRLDKDGNYDVLEFQSLLQGQQDFVFVDGSSGDARRAFANTSKENGGAGMAGNVGDTFLNKLDPKNQAFDQDLYNQYVEFIISEETKKAQSKYKPQVSVTQKPLGNAQEGLSQEDIDFLTGPSKSKLSYGNVQLKFDAGMYDDVTDRNIEVNIVPESLLPGQGELQEFFEKQYKDEVGDTNKSVKGQVTRLGLTVDNVKVASVKFGKKEYLIPYESISSEIAELKKTSVGYKIGQFESESTSQGIDTSKYNK